MSFGAAPGSRRGFAARAEPLSAGAAFVGNLNAVSVGRGRLRSCCHFHTAMVLADVVSKRRIAKAISPLLPRSQFSLNSATIFLALTVNELCLTEIHTDHERRFLEKRCRCFEKDLIIKVNNKAIQKAVALLDSLTGGRAIESPEK